MASGGAITALRSKIQQHLIQQLRRTQEGFQDPVETFKQQILNLLAPLPATDPTVDRYDLCKVFFILLQNVDNTEQDLRALFVRISSNNGLRDSDLPISEERSIAEFGETHGAQFYKDQFPFCPVVLKEDEEVRCWEDCPLPFESRKKLGDGAAGAVYKVKVIAGHFNPKDERMGPNKIGLDFAWKEFTHCDNPEEAYETERKILEIIKNTPLIESMDNIMLARGSLLRRNTYSLYFDLADCDLRQYLEDPATSIPDSVEEVRLFLRRFRGLVDALNFLHTKVTSSKTGEILEFSHLDLRPANILVFGRGSETEIWKIHDFGVSRVQKAPLSPERKVFTWLIPSPRDQAHSGTKVWRDGTFLAPETQLRTGYDMSKAKPASDIWSLGCILSLVLSFLDEGSKSVKEFEEKRRPPRSSKDPFFVQKGGNFILNPKVVEWLKVLRERIESGKDKPVNLVVRAMISMLTRHLLVIKQERRASSEKVKDAFDKIMQKFDPSIKPEGHILISIANRVFGVFNSSFQAMKDPTPDPKQFQLQIPKESISSKFSADGSYLAFFSAKEIVVYEMDAVLSSDQAKPAITRPPHMSKPAEGSVSWAGFDLCSKYLVAFTRQGYSQCYVYPLSISLPPPGGIPIKHANLPSIHKVALSHDGEVLVIVVIEHVSGESKPNYYVYSSRVEDIRNTPTTASRESPPSLPWKSQLLNSINSRNRLEIRHVEAVKFSEDSQLIVLLSQPGGANTQIFYAWSKVKGKYKFMNQVPFECSGNIDRKQSWLTAFIPLMPTPSILTVTFKRNLTRRGFTSESAHLDWASQELKLEILDVLPLAKNDRHYIFIGREVRSEGTIKALYAEVQGLGDKMEKVHFDYVLDLECYYWEAGKNSASTLSEGEIFLTAMIEDSGFLRETFRPSAPRIK